MADLGRWLTGAYQVPVQPASAADLSDLDALEEPIEDDERLR